MPLKLEIAGVDRITRLVSVHMSFDANGRAVATLISEDGYIPDRQATVVAYAKDGSTPFFRGFVLDRVVSGLTPGSVHNRVEIKCPSLAAYADEVSVTLTYSSQIDAGDVFADIMAVLADYGLTHTPVSTGVLLEPFSWTGKKASEAMREVAEKSGRVWRELPDGSIVLETPGASAAPVAITDGDMHCLDITRRDAPRLPATDVILTCGPTGALRTTQVWVADGVATSWQTDIPATDPPPLLVCVDDGVTPRLAPIGDGGAFEWDRDTHTLHLGTDSQPTDATILTLGPTDAFPGIEGFMGVYPFEARATNGNTPKIEYRETKPDITDYAAGVQLAEAILPRASVEYFEIDVVTDEDGFEPGQALTVDVTDFRGGIDDDFLIQSVDVTWVKGDEYWEYVLSCVSGLAYQSTSKDVWRQNTGGGSGVAVVSGGGGITTNILSSPSFLGGSREASVPMASTPAWTPVLSAVQFHAAGSFSGRVRVELKARAGGVGVTARLWNVTDGASAGQSSEVTSTSFVETNFVVTIESGKVYRLEIISDTASASAYGIGSLEAA